MRPPVAALAVVALLALVAARPVRADQKPAPVADPPAQADAPPAPVAPVAGPVPSPMPDDESFDLMLPRLDRGLAAARADTTFDPVVVIEAEETAAVAEQVLEEGETDVAVELLKEAIALLPATVPE